MVEAGGHAELGKEAASDDLEGCVARPQRCENDRVFAIGVTCVGLLPVAMLLVALFVKCPSSSSFRHMPSSGLA